MLPQSWLTSYSLRTKHTPHHLSRLFIHRDQITTTAVHFKSRLVVVCIFLQSKGARQFFSSARIQWMVTPTMPPDGRTSSKRPLTSTSNWFLLRWPCYSTMAVIIQSNLMRCRCVFSYICLLICYYTAVSLYLPYMTLQMIQVGLNIEEIAIIYSVLPFVTSVMPPIAGGSFYIMKFFFLYL